MQDNLSIDSWNRFDDATYVEFRVKPVQREAVRKGPFRHLAGGPPYRTRVRRAAPGKRGQEQSGTAHRADSANPVR